MNNLNINLNSEIKKRLVSTDNSCGYYFLRRIIVTPNFDKSYI